MGRRRRREGPEHTGVLVVDKPAGPTSHDVVQQVRRAAGQSRVGHTGTLDPAATGVLVLCLGRATKLVRFLQAGTKTYAARMVLGVETDSQDADGVEIARTPAGHVDERTVCESLTRFQGTITQIPPMVSAVKVGGERLHAKARRGEVVERGPRTVTIDDLLLDAYVPGEHPEVSFLVTCSAGTYVRTLAHDVGRDLGVGASLTSLRRVANGPFGDDEAHEVATIVEAGETGEVASLLLDPIEAVRRALPVVPVDDEHLVRRLVQGGRLPARGQSGPFAVTAGAQLIGIYADVVDGPDGRALDDGPADPAGAADGRPAGEARPELVWTRPEELA